MPITNLNVEPPPSPVEHEVRARWEAKRKRFNEQYLQRCESRGDPVIRPEETQEELDDIWRVVRAAQLEQTRATIQREAQKARRKLMKRSEEAKSLESQTILRHQQHRTANPDHRGSSLDEEQHLPSTNSHQTGSTSGSSPEEYRTDQTASPPDATTKQHPTSPRTPSLSVPTLDDLALESTRPHKSNYVGLLPLRAKKTPPPKYALVRTQQQTQPPVQPLSQPSPSRPQHYQKHAKRISASSDGEGFGAMGTYERGALIEDDEEKEEKVSGFSDINWYGRGTLVEDQEGELEAVSPLSLGEPLEPILGKRKRRDADETPELSRDIKRWRGAPEKRRR